MIYLNREQTLSYCDGPPAFRIRAHLLISFDVPATTAQLIQFLMRLASTSSSVPSGVRTGREHLLR